MRTDGLRSREAWLWLPVRMQEPRAGRSPQACRGSPTPDPSPPRPNISGPETTCGGATARGQPLAWAGPRTQTRPAPSQPALRAPSPSRDPHSKSGDYVQSCNTHTVEIHAKVEIGFCQTSYDPKSPPRKSSLFLQSCTATVQLSPGPHSPAQAHPASWGTRPAHLCTRTPAHTGEPVSGRSLQRHAEALICSPPLVLQGRRSAGTKTQQAESSGPGGGPLRRPQSHHRVYCSEQPGNEDGCSPRVQQTPLRDHRREGRNSPPAGSTLRGTLRPGVSLAPGDVSRTLGGRVKLGERGIGRLLWPGL